MIEEWGYVCITRDSIDVFANNSHIKDSAFLALERICRIFSVHLVLAKNNVVEAVFNVMNAC